MPKFFKTGLCRLLPTHPCPRLALRCKCWRQKIWRRWEQQRVYGQGALSLNDASDPMQKSHELAKGEVGSVWLANGKIAVARFPWRSKIWISRTVAR